MDLGLEGMMEKAKQMAQEGLPKCEVCGGHLMAGAGTFQYDGSPIVLCGKCISKAVDFYLTARAERLNAKE